MYPNEKIYPLSEKRNPPASSRIRTPFPGTPGEAKRFSGDTPSGGYYSNRTGQGEDPDPTSSDRGSAPLPEIPPEVLSNAGGNPGPSNASGSRPFGGQVSALKGSISPHSPEVNRQSLMGRVRQFFDDGNAHWDAEGSFPS